jgi:ankyrin repeat protein
MSEADQKLLEASKGHLSLQEAQIAISEGAKIDAKDANGMCALEYCLSYGKGNEELALYLIRQGADLESLGHGPFPVKDEYLQAAATLGFVKVMQELIARGAKINSKTFLEETPLYAAVGAHQIAAAEFLIAQGAKVNLLNGKINEVTALSLAKCLYTPQDPTLQFLKEHGGKTTEDYIENPEPGLLEVSLENYIVFFLWT